MKRHIFKLSILFSTIVFGLGIVFTGCDDDPVEPTIEKPDISIIFNHVWEGADLEMGKWYVTEPGDSFQPSLNKYHINNIYLVTTEGDDVMVKDWDMISYPDEGNKNIKLSGVEDKVFNKIKFTIGVEDSLANYNGELNNLFVDPMYWGMANGYINMKVEGRYVKTDNSIGDVYLHIGGYAGDQQTAYVIELDLAQNTRMAIGENEININVDLAQFFYNPNDISLQQYNLLHMPGATAVMISKNIPTMFSVKQ